MATNRIKRFYSPCHWTLADRIAHYTAPPDEHGCTLWTGDNTRGYGRLTICGKKHMVHRLVWVSTHGKIPAGMCVCHKCDVPACVNVNHMFLGSRTENARDRHTKQRDAKGVENGQCVLSKESVAAIRADGRFHRVIAVAYGISRTNVGLIKQRKTWRHL